MVGGKSREGACEAERKEGRYEKGTRREAEGQLSSDPFRLSPLQPPAFLLGYEPPIKSSKDDGLTSRRHLSRSEERRPGEGKKGRKESWLWPILRSCFDGERGGRWDSK